jgi:hypothetical protein
MIAAQGSSGAIALPVLNAKRFLLTQPTSYFALNLPFKECENYKQPLSFTLQKAAIILACTPSQLVVVGAKSCW